MNVWAGYAPMPYNELSSYQDTIDETKRRYIQENLLLIYQSLKVGKELKKLSAAKIFTFCD